MRTARITRRLSLTYAQVRIEKIWFEFLIKIESFCFTICDTWVFFFYWSIFLMLFVSFLLTTVCIKGWWCVCLFVCVGFAWIVCQKQADYFDSFRSTLSTNWLLFFNLFCSIFIKFLECWKNYKDFLYTTHQNETNKLVEWLSSLFDF